MDSSSSSGRSTSPPSHGGSSISEDIFDGHEDPVVIVGLACRLPGGSSSPSKLWNFLRENRSAQGPWPKSRLNIDGFYHPNRDHPDTLHNTGGYFIDDELHNFDNDFFGINSIEAARMDAQQKKLLEVVYECLENSGTPLERVSGTPVGCYVANFLVDHAINQAPAQETSNAYSATGVTPTILANRISHAFNLQGPSMVVDTACSASIYALHLACQAVTRGECTSAVVAASNLIQSAAYHMLNVKSGVLSPTSTCHTFDSSADGYGRADAISAIYIKKLSAAIRDGDLIRAVVRGTAVNSNGKTAGISLPRAETQAQCIRNAYASAGLSLDETSYVECHGTGTAVGDPIEVNALNMAFQRQREPSRPLLIGSVKTNLGHSEAASGLTSILKLVLAFENDIIPATIGVRTPNPKLKLQDWNVEIVTHNVNWPNNFTYRRASVNSFGFGGANAHAILESAASFLNARPWLQSTACSPPHNRTKHLIPFSATSPASLNELTKHWPRAISKASVQSIVYELSCRRTLSHPLKGFLVCDKRDIADGVELPLLDSDNVVSTELPRLAFVFTGQGAQWPGMGKELFEEFPCFRDVIHLMDRRLQSLPDPPSWSIEQEICAPAQRSRIHDAAFSQPLCTALQVGIVTVLDSVGVHPTGIIGHSSGEIAAAFAARVLTAEQAIVCAYYRGKSVSELDDGGAMLATQLTEYEAQTLLRDMDLEEKVALACLNSPTSTTLSGDRDGVELVQTRLKSENKFARLLSTGGKAYHSHRMKKIGAGYRDRLLAFMGEAFDPSPVVRFVSTRTTEFVTEPLQADYWRENADSTVRFTEGLTTLLTNDRYHIIEIGPHSTLAMPIKQIVKEIVPALVDFKYFAAMSRGTDSSEALLKLLGKLFVAGHKVRLDRANGFDPHQGRLKEAAELETCPWQYGTLHKSENRQLAEWEQRKYPKHDLLGSEMFGLSKRYRMWRNHLSIKDVPWLADHKLGEIIVFPAAGYCAMAIEAALQYADRDCASITLKDLSISQPLLISVERGSKHTEVFTHLRPADGHHTWALEISSISEGKSVLHADGLIQVDDSSTLNSITEIHDSKQDIATAKAAFYQRLIEEGLNFGPAFQSIDNIALYVTNGEHFARSQTSTQREQSGQFKHESRYPLHPITIDALLQTSIIATGKGNLKELRASVPTFLGALTVDLQNPASTSTYQIRAKARVHESCQTLIEAELVHSNTLIAQISEVKLTSFDGGRFVERGKVRMPFTRLQWQPDVSMNSLIRLNAEIPGTMDYCTQSLLDMVCHKNPNLHVLDILEVGEAKMPCRVSDSETLLPYASRESTSLAELDQFCEERALMGIMYDLVLFHNMTDLETFLQSHLHSVRQRFSTELLLLSPPLKQSEMLDELQIVTQVVVGEEIGAVLYHASGEKKPPIHGNSSHIYLIDDESQHLSSPGINQIGKELTQRGFSIEKLRLDAADIERVPPASLIVSLVEDNGPVLSTSGNEQFECLKTVVSKARHLLWVTRGDVLDGINPEAALIQGIARTVRLEQPENLFTTLNLSSEVDYTTLGSYISAIMSVPKSGFFTQDFEFSGDSKSLRCCRIVPNEVLNSLYRQKEGLEDSYKTLEECKAHRLKMTTPGWPETLRFSKDSESSMTEALDTDQVEVTIQTVGLTSTNIHVLQGKAPTPADKVVTQFVGIVNGIGPEVHGLQVGDRVLALHATHLQRYVRLPAKSCQKLLKNESTERMCLAAIPFCTAFHALRDRISMQPNETLLVHWTGNYTDTAIIKLARSLEIEVFVIVADEVDRATVSNFHTSARIAALTDQNLQAKLRDLTKGEGFDGLVSARPTELPEKVWKSLSSCARCAFLDVGPDNAPSFNSSNLPCNGSATQVSINHLLNCPCSHHQKKLQQLLKGALALCRLDEIPFDGQYERIDVSNLIGQVKDLLKRPRSQLLMLSLQDKDSLLKVDAERYLYKFDPEKVYILVGCLGGLGRALSRWMLGRGAKRFAFLGRSGTDRKVARDLVQELEDAGATTTVVRGDVTSLTDVESLFAVASGSIGGIVQAAMGLNERPFRNMDASSWHAGIDAKVQGTWNIHHAIQTSGQQPDFLLLLSSLNGSVGAYTESNYCAANAFLDAFARYRRRQGLCCTSLALGAISGVGYVAENPEVEAHFLRKGIRPLPEKEFLQMIDISLSWNESKTSQTPHDPFRSAHILTGLEPLDVKTLQELGIPQKNPVEGDPRALFWSKAYTTSNERQTAEKDAVADVRELIKKCYVDNGESMLGIDYRGAADTVAELIVQGLAELLARSADQIEVTKPIARYGLDSMLGSEFRAWFYKTFTVDVALMDIMASDVTVGRLGQVVCDGLCAAATSSSKVSGG